MATGSSQASPQKQGLLVRVGVLLILSLPSREARSLSASGGEWECQTLGQLPEGCPEHVGPPCPACYTNPLRDYTPGDSTELSSELRTAMEAKLQQYIQLLLQNKPPVASRTPLTGDSFSSSRVFDGAAGYSLIFLKLAKQTSNETYLTLSDQYLQQAIDLLPEQEMMDKASGCNGFLWSRAGTYAVAAIIKEYLQDIEGARSYTDKLYNMLDESLISSRYDDLDCGRAGLLSAIDFINTNTLGQLPSAPRITVQQVANAIVERGAELMNSSAPYLQWHGPNDSGLWLGTSHGSAGVLHQLLNVPELLMNDSAVALIRQTLDHTVYVQFPSGNFPSEYQDPSVDGRVAWDHGAGGVSGTLLRAALVLHDSKYLDSATKALECIWQKGLLTKGLMNCHGIGGNTYAMFRAGQELRSSKHVFRGLQFQQYVVNQPMLSDPGKMRKTDPPSLDFQLWVGSIPSAVMLWTDLLYSKERHMTGYLPEL